MTLAAEGVNLIIKYRILCLFKLSLGSSSEILSILLTPAIVDFIT